jgi:ADP-ribosyl-[dinitrogen reductase] hydrolase
MLLECAVSDAYGAGFEFNQSAYEANRNDLGDYVRHMGHPGLLPGMYTDDTQMSIALAELMLAERSWNPIRIATAFLAAFKRDQRKGYARRFQGFLESVDSGEEFVAQILPNSDRSGSSMRSAVLGMYGNTEEVYEKCQMQAKLTHDTPNGIASALMVAFSSHFFYHCIDEKANLLKWLSNQLGDHWKYPHTEWTGKVGVVGVECVRAALTALMRNTKMSTLLVDCVSFTGDVDTVAAIAGSIGSVCDEIEQDIPQHLIDKLENGSFGKDYLIALDKMMSDNFPR